MIYTASTPDASGTLHYGKAYTFTIAMRLAACHAGTLVVFRYHPNSGPRWEITRMTIGEACRLYRMSTESSDEYPIDDDDTANRLIHGDVVIDDDGFEYTVCDPITSGGVHVYRS